MSPSLQTMGFFMSDINFCNTKEQLNHLGEVVTGKVDGSPTGADIDTSTLPYTGQVRKTLPALESEYEQSIADKEAEADAVIDTYRLLNKGPYSSGITLESKFEYITYNGESYFATNPPYTTTATLPDADGNLFVGGYTTLDEVTSNIGELTNYQATSVADMVEGKTVGGVVVAHNEGEYWIVNDGSIRVYSITSSQTTTPVGEGLYAKAESSGDFIGDEGKKYKIISGAIRSVGGVWEFVQDSTHEPIGFDGIMTNENGTVTLSHSVGSEKVVLLMCTVDETYSKVGLICGASIGLSESTVSFSAPLSFEVNMDTLQVTTPSYFQGDVTATVETDHVKIVHPEVYSGNRLSCVKTSSQINSDSVISLSHGSGLTNCYFDVNIYGVAAYNGTDWDISNTNTLNGVSADFVGTEMIISHPSSNSVTFSLNGRYPIITHPGGLGFNTIPVTFTDLSGTPVTEPETNMRAYFTRGNVKGIEGSLRTAALGSYGFTAPYAKVDARKLDISFSNVELFGIMEIG